MTDPTGAALIGHSIWHVAAYVEAHHDPMLGPYEIFADDGVEYGYRITVERIPHQPPVALAGD